MANLGKSGEKQTKGKVFVLVIEIIIFWPSLKLTSRTTLGTGGCRFGVLDIKPLLKMCFLIESLKDFELLRELSVVFKRFMACNCNGVPGNMEKKT